MPARPRPTILEELLEQWEPPLRRPMFCGWHPRCVRAAEEGAVECDRERCPVIGPDLFVPCASA